MKGVLQLKQVEVDLIPICKLVCCCRIRAETSDCEGSCCVSTSCRSAGTKLNAPDTGDAILCWRHGGVCSCDVEVLPA